MSDKTLGFDDIEAAQNMRRWLQKALEAQGANMTSAFTYGNGLAEIVIELEGHRYRVTIKPLPDKP